MSDRRPAAVPSSLEAFGEVLWPSDAIPPILSRGVQAALDEWLEEIWAREELLEVGLQPRSRALFEGVPGVGKTTLAHHLAARLGLAMVAVRPDKIINIYIGATGQNIGALFDIAQRNAEPVVIFLDEFESYGGKRTAVGHNPASEKNSNNSVNTLLQRIEGFTKGYLIAATNMASELDQAVWRRFDLQIRIELPGQREREQILARYLSPFQLPADELTDLANAFAGAAPALMRQFAEGLKRQFVVGPKVGWDMERGKVFERLIAAVTPHPDLDKPRLWKRGATDPAVQGLTWPLVNPRGAPALRHKRIRRAA